MVPSTQESSQSSELGTTNIPLYTLFCGSQTATSTDTNRRRSRTSGCGSWIFSGATSLLSTGYSLWTVTNFAEEDGGDNDPVKGMNVVPVHRAFAAGFATRIVGSGKHSQAGRGCECVSEGVGCRDCGRPLGYRSKKCSAHIEGAVGLDGIRLKSGRFTYHFYAEAASSSSSPALTVCVPSTGSREGGAYTRESYFGPTNPGVEGFPFMSFEISDSLHAIPPFPHDGPSHTPRRERHHRHTSMRRPSTGGDDDDGMPGLTRVDDSDDEVWPPPAHNPDHTEDWSPEYLSNIQVPTYTRSPASTWPIPTHEDVSRDPTPTSSHIATRQHHHDADDSDSNSMPGLRDVSDSSEEDDELDPESDPDDEYSLNDGMRNRIQNLRWRSFVIPARPIPYRLRVRYDEIERIYNAEFAAGPANFEHAGETPTSQGPQVPQSAGALLWDLDRPPTSYHHTGNVPNTGLTTIGRAVLDRQAGHAHPDTRSRLQSGFWGDAMDSRLGTRRGLVVTGATNAVLSTLLNSRAQASRALSSSPGPADPGLIATALATSQSAALDRTPSAGVPQDPPVEDEDKIEEDPISPSDSVPGLVADVPWSPVYYGDTANHWTYMGTHDAPRYPDFAFPSLFQHRESFDAAHGRSYDIPVGSGLIPDVTFSRPLVGPPTWSLSGELRQRAQDQLLHLGPEAWNVENPSSESDELEEWVMRRASWLAWRDTPWDDNGGEGWQCRGTVLSGARRPWAAR